MKIKLITSLCCALATTTVFATIPNNKEDLKNTTLTKLFNSGTSFAASAYTLEEGSDSNFVITKFWNDNGKITPINFNVKVNNYNDQDADTTYYYKWELDSKNHRKLSTANSLSEADFSVSVNSATNKPINNSPDFTEITVKNNFVNLNGAIYNEKYKMSHIFGNFINNYSTGSAAGIFNVKEAGIVAGSYIGNNVSSSSSNYTQGVAFSNFGPTMGLYGDYIGNYVSSTSSNPTHGGAMYNGVGGNINIMRGDFIGNYVSSSSSSCGGAFSNHSDMRDLVGNFISNYVSSTTTSFGGAIYNDKNLNHVKGDFIGNYVSSSSSSYGGAIYNSDKVSYIYGDFIGNYASSSNPYGGAIYNDSQGNMTISEKSSFTGNYITTDNGDTKIFEAIYQSAKNSTARINFHAKDTTGNTNLIVVNDGINGDSDGKANQILDINKIINSRLSVANNTVEFNSFVKNNTVNVHNGSLKLGKFVGLNLNVNGAELVIPETSASLENVDMTVANGAKLEIATAVTATTNTAIILNGTMSFNSTEGSSISLDETSSLTIAGGSLSLNLGNILGEFTYELIQSGNAENLGIVLSTLQNTDNLSVYANDILLDESDWAVSKGLGDKSNWIVVSGTAVPEPSTYAIIFGVLALGIAAYRRRK